MTKRGLQLFTPRKQNIENEISILEKEYGLNLPPKYRLFVSMFLLGENAIKLEKVFNSDSGKPIEFEEYKYHTDLDFGFAHFEEINEVFKYWKENLGYDVPDYENGYIRIASITRGGAIFVGTKGKLKDKIILNLWDFDEYYILANSIFEFVSDLSTFIVTNKVSNFDLNNLYKNWGEDFWRIRPNETAPPNPPLAGNADHREESP